MHAPSSHRVLAIIICLSMLIAPAILGAQRKPTSRKSVKIEARYTEPPCRKKKCVDDGELMLGGLMGVVTKEDVTEALELFESGCAQSVMEACVKAADLLIAGGYIPQDLDRAEVLYKKACEKDFISGCVGLGLIYASDQRRDEKKARAFFGGACDRKNGEGCYFLADMEMTPVRAELARRQKAGKQATAKAMDANTSAKLDAAIELYKKSCALWFATGCLALVEIYSLEVVGRVDEKKARRYTVVACEHGSSLACRSLGKQHDREKQYSDAFPFFEKACEFGDPKGCLYTGYYFEKGYGKTRDLGEAVKQYTRGCALGDDDLCLAARSAKALEKKEAASADGARKAPEK